MISKKIWKYFVFIFLVNFLIFNWNEVSWIFNYKAVSEIVQSFFQKNNPIAISNSFKDAAIGYSDSENNLEIAKIGISAPLISATDEKDVNKDLSGGVVIFPGSVFPGERGQTIILGHSAPSSWPKINYTWVFTRLDELKEGDEIILHFNHQKLTYYVAEKTFLNKGEEINQRDLTSSKNTLVLISCWPPSTGLKRIALRAVLK